MPADILAFPLTRRHAFVRRHAAIMATLSPTAADRHIAAQLRVQCAALTRKGVATEIVEKEKASLATALRAEVIRISLHRGGVA